VRKTVIKPIRLEEDGEEAKKQFIAIKNCKRVTERVEKLS